jgi:predicted DNA-binding ribbon-helix-helix protein
MRYASSMQRQRAPSREGVRTTLRVPDEVYAEARRLAHQMGTTTNDALVQLAEEAVDARQRRERIAEVAGQRRAAAAQVSSVEAVEDFPSPDDLRAAMLSGRAES